ncbi:hypothetical protein Tco_0956513, partial [Tanacetum coccineum]
LRCLPRRLCRLTLLNQGQELCNRYLPSEDQQYQNKEGLELLNMWRGKVQDRTRQKAWGMSLDETSDFLAALTNIIGSTHTLELKSHTYYEHGTFESFTCWKLHSIEAAVKSAGSSTIDAVPDVSCSSGKRLEELEDSDAESLLSQSEGKKKKQLAPVASLPCLKLKKHTDTQLFVCYAYRYITDVSDLE